MRSDEGIRPSIWDLTAEVPAQPTRALGSSTDVCVIGAGIAGLTTAYALLQAGRRVVVLDDGPIGGGESGRTTAHLDSAFDDGYAAVERMHGAEVARLLGESFRAGVDSIEQIVRSEGIDCGFARLDGWWVPSTEDAAERLADELSAAQRAGFADVQLVQEHPMAGTFPGAALRFPQQAQFHILRYLTGLAAAIERLGGVIHTDTHVLEVKDAESDAGTCTVQLDDDRTLEAAQVVVATNSPISDRVTMHTKQAAYRTYAIAANVAAGAVPPGLYWDTDEPYHYVRLLDGTRAGGEADVLIVGGEDHKTGQSDDESAAFDRLEAWTRARFPIDGVTARWSGQVMEPVDFIGYIGRDPGSRRVFIITGDSGNGMTHGTIAGLLLPDLMAGRAHRWESLFSPSRITVSGTTVTGYAKETLNVAAQYADLVTGGDVDDVLQIPVGEGRIIRRGMRKLAVYKPVEGPALIRSAICPHLGCVVAWNTAEKTWDCPCHGSRFATDGAVINGPSPVPLAEESLE